MKSPLHNACSHIVGMNPHGSNEVEMGVLKSQAAIFSHRLNNETPIEVTQIKLLHLHVQVNLLINE